MDNIRNIYFGIFSSLLNYAAQVWGQHDNSHIKRIIKLQDKAIRVINFAKFREPTSKLYLKSEILKFKDNITLNNFLFVHNSLNRRLPTAVQDKFLRRHQHFFRNGCRSPFPTSAPARIIAYLHIAVNYFEWRHFLRRRQCIIAVVTGNSEAIALFSKIVRFAKGMLKALHWI